MRNTYKIEFGKCPSNFSVRLIFSLIIILSALLFSGCGRSKDQPVPESNSFAFHKEGAKPGDEQTIICKKIPFTFRWCPPGSFLMGKGPENSSGSTMNNESSRFPATHNETTSSEVTLSQGFWILETEVTQAMWKSVMWNNPSRYKDRQLQAPVESVTWYQCMDFIKILNSHKLLPKDCSFSLPNEAQWEYAACAGEKPFSLQSPEKVSSIAWFGGGPAGGLLPGGVERTQKVKTKSPNAWGIYDMLGNVEEWCLDQFRDDRQVFTKNILHDPVYEFSANGPDKIAVPVVCRGGGAFSPKCQVEERNQWPANNSAPTLGFRIIINGPPVKSKYSPKPDSVPHENSNRRSDHSTSDIHKRNNSNSSGNNDSSLRNNDNSSAPFRHNTPSFDRSAPDDTSISGKTSRSDQTLLPDKTSSDKTSQSANNSLSGASSNSDRNPVKESEASRYAEDQDSLVIPQKFYAGAGSYKDYKTGENIYKGDRSVEKSITPTAEQVEWSVTVDEQEPIIDDESEPLPSVFPIFKDSRLVDLSKGVLNARLFFPNQKRHQIFCTCQAKINDKPNQLSDLVEFHDFDRDIHKVYISPVSSSFESILPERNWLFGIRRTAQGSSTTPTNIITFFRITPNDQFKMILHFDPYKNGSQHTIYNNQPDLFNTHKEVNKLKAVDSNHFITGNETKITLWDIRNLQSSYSIICNAHFTDVSDDGKWLCIPVRSFYASTQGIEIRDALSGKVHGVIPGRREGVFATRFSPSGKNLAVLYREHLVIYSMKDGSICCSINCPNAASSLNYLLWNGENIIMNNGLLFDLERKMLLCHYLTLDSKTNAMISHDGRVWITFFDSKGGYLINEKLPHKLVENAFLKMDLNELFDFHPDIPMNLRVLSNGESLDKRFPNLLPIWKKHLEKRGFIISEQANKTLTINFRFPSAQEIKAEYPKAESRTFRSDYLFQETRLESQSRIGNSINQTVLWQNDRLWYNQNWRRQFGARYGNKASLTDDAQWIDYIDQINLPRYISKGDKISTAAPIQVLFDEKGVEIVPQ